MKMMIKKVLLSALLTTMLAATQAYADTYEVETGKNTYTYTNKDGVELEATTTTYATISSGSETGTNSKTETTQTGTKFNQTKETFCSGAANCIQPFTQDSATSLINQRATTNSVTTTGVVTQLPTMVTPPLCPPTCPPPPPPPPPMCPPICPVMP